MNKDREANIVRIAAPFFVVMLLCLAACGDGGGPTDVPALTRPEIVPGAVVRLSQEDETGYKRVREGEAGPGILLTFPPVEYAAIPERALRLAGRVEPGVEVLIDGDPAAVHPGGSFVALLPLSPGENTITLTARSPRGETIYPLTIRREKPVTGTNAFSPFKRTRTGTVTAPRTPLHLRPGGTRLLTLPEGAVLTVTGQSGGYLRTDLGGGLSGWIEAEAVALGGDAPDEPYRAGNVEFDPARSRARFTLETAVPARVEYLSPSAADVIFYNTVVDTRSINLGDWEGTCTWSQEADGRAVFHLRGAPEWCRWSLDWDEGGYLLSWKGHPGRGKKTVICLDPGHGGKNRGAVSPGGIAEKEANLFLARMVAEKLRRRGLAVFLTREEDSTVGLYERTDIARSKNADLLLSLHYNSVDTDRDPRAATGCTVLYYRPPARELAGDLYRSLKKIGLSGRGVRWRSLAVIRPGDLVAALVEVAYLSNPDDEALVMDPAFREKTAEAIADGVIEYLGE